MKAADLAEIYTKNRTGETLARLAFNEVKGTAELAKKRKISTNEALIAIIRETDERWRAFSKLCPDVSPEGFKIMLHTMTPVSKELYP